MATEIVDLLIKDGDKMATEIVDLLTKDGDFPSIFLYVYHVG